MAKHKQYARGRQDLFLTFNLKLELEHWILRKVKVYINRLYAARISSMPGPARVFYDSDSSLDALANIKIGIVGYGNQGRAQALNLRDSGLNVVPGARPDGVSWQSAINDGFAPAPLKEVVSTCNILVLTLPDEVMAEVYNTSIKPAINDPKTFIFAHGFVIHHNVIQLPADSDILLVAPTGPGAKLRSLFAGGKGLPSLVAVEQDASGSAWKKCLAYAKGIGSLRAGAVETTFKEEVIVDLFCEQAVLCGGIPSLIKASFDTLVKSGYQPELAYISCLKEVKLISDLLFERGMYEMRKAISNTAKYGSALAGPELIDSRTRAGLEKLLDRIESGKFAVQFKEDYLSGSPVINELLEEEKNSRLDRVGKELTRRLDF